MATSKSPAKNPDISETGTSDLEAEVNDQDPKDLLYRSDLTELTPVEAFKWSVEGDQSPCAFISIPKCLGPMLILHSSRSCGLCV
jgi:hypothetical protein